MSMNNTDVSGRSQVLTNISERTRFMMKSYLSLNCIITLELDRIERSFINLSI